MTTERDRRNQYQYELEQEVAKAKAEGRESGLAEGEAIGLEKGEKIGEARGKADGIEETKLATAKKMLALGLGLDVIAQVTEFSVEELKDIK